MMGEAVFGTGRAPAALWFYFTFLCFAFFSAGERARLKEAGVLLLRVFLMLLPFFFFFFFINKPTLKQRQRVSQLVSLGLFSDRNSCQTLTRSHILYN